MIFRDKEYTVNIKGGKTLFSPVGLYTGLGDRIVFQAIIQKYRMDNPDETILTPDWVLFEDEIREYAPDKLFWADKSDYIKPPGGAIYYSLYEEAEALREIGIFPEIMKPTIADTENVRKYGKIDYAILHLRNIKHRRGHNVEPEIANAVIAVLKRKTERRYRVASFFRRLAGKKRIKAIILVGNDAPHPEIMTDGDIIDLRQKLSLPEITWLMQWAELFIGKDSGLAHLAGACGCPLVVWGFWERKYFPKVPDGQGMFLMREESTPESVMAAIERFF